MRRSIFILSLLIIAISAPAGVMAQVVSVEVSAPVVVQQLPPEEYIPEGDPTPPPQIAVQEPELVVVPSGNVQVYMVPNTVGVYFHGGRWYRHHHGVWFGAVSYNAPWVIVQPAIVPSFIVDIPPAYPLYLPPSYHRIHYRDFHSNWRSWDRDRHWERQHWYQNERRADIRRDRIHRANERMTIDRRERHERVKADPVGYKNRLADPAKYHKPVHVDPQKPGHVGPQRPVHVDPQKPGHVGPQRPVHVDPQKPEHVGLQKPVHVDQQKPGVINKPLPPPQPRQQHQLKPQVQQPRTQVQPRQQQQPRPQIQQRQQKQPKPQVQQKPLDDKDKNKIR